MPALPFSKSWQATHAAEALQCYLLRRVGWVQLAQDFRCHHRLRFGSSHDESSVHTSPWKSRIKSSKRTAVNVGKPWKTVYFPICHYWCFFHVFPCLLVEKNLWGSGDPVEITPHQLFSGGLPVPILGPIRSPVCDSLNLFGERREKPKKNATVLEGQIPMKSSYIYIHNVT